MSITSSEQADRVPIALLPLLRALGDLKRIRSAGSTGSIGQRLFVSSWARLVAGEELALVADSIVAASLVATSLGDLNGSILQAAGLPTAEITRIIQKAIRFSAGSFDTSLCEKLIQTPLSKIVTGPVPPFVTLLAAQPRAGATSPGRGRLVLEPPENHAEHCITVAVYGVLLSSAWGAKREDVFLAGLAHHLHNALLPDAGYAGEVLLGEWLHPAMTTATQLALQELPHALRTLVETACQILPTVASPEGCAFHAADTLDRVLQQEHHLRAVNVKMDYVLREMELVHAGPIKPFQDAVLTRMGLAA